MFIGARVAYNFGGVSRAGVVTAASFDRCMVKFDSLNSVEVSPERLQLINFWKTKKNPVEIGTFRAFPPNTDPMTIFKSKKAIIFGQAGIRAVWHWANNIVYDNKMHEPNFAVINSSAVYGRYEYGHNKSIMQISASKCHSMLEFTETIVHEMIHQMNQEVEHANYAEEGGHGASFLRWIPIIRAKTGLNINVKGDAANDVTEHDDETISQETKTKPFIFIIIKSKTQYLGFLTDRDNLGSVYAGLLTLANNNGWDEKIYAGISDFARVKAELNNTNNGTLPRKFKTFSVGLVGMLGKTCKPITGYYPPPSNL